MLNTVFVSSSLVQTERSLSVLWAAILCVLMVLTKSIQLGASSFPPFFPLVICVGICFKDFTCPSTNGLEVYCRGWHPLNFFFPAVSFTLIDNKRPSQSWSSLGLVKLLSFCHSAVTKKLILSLSSLPSSGCLRPLSMTLNLDALDLSSTGLLPVSLWCVTTFILHCCVIASSATDHC